MIEPSHVVDPSFAYPIRGLLGEGFEPRLEIGVKNVFDGEYVESNRHGTENFPADPRSFWVNLSFDF